MLATQVYSFLSARNDVGASAAVAMFMAAVLAVLLVVYLKFFAEEGSRMKSRNRWSRYAIEVRALKILRPLGIAFFVLITLFPFYYMVLLSMREISEVIESPGQGVRGPRRPLASTPTSGCSSRRATAARGSCASCSTRWGWPSGPWS